MLRKLLSPIVNFLGFLFFKLFTYTLVLIVILSVIDITATTYIKQKRLAYQAVLNGYSYAQGVVLTTFHAEPKRNKEEYIQYIYDKVRIEARKNKVPIKLAYAVLQVESKKNRYATSRKGARGLFQVMPANAEWCGLDPDDLYHLDENISCGMKLLGAELVRYKDESNALKAYNGGPTCVKYRCIESEKYVKLVSIEKQNLS